ncbi:MAG: PepSY-associated region [Firmicutes bacterium]|nr:PepSY-associated region [Bacillota bacterium]MBP2659323.1 PepSY-associated region [Bacillota bacterium]
MMNIKHIKVWYVAHKWTSLMCAIFLLLMCITGLPLIFLQEINALPSEYNQPVPKMSNNNYPVRSDQMVAAIQENYPNEKIHYVHFEDERKSIIWGLIPSDAEGNNVSHTLIFKTSTAQVSEEVKPIAGQGSDFLEGVKGLHYNLLAGAAGELILAVMGLLFLVALLSGMMLYGPFSKRLPFGTIRKLGSPRHKWMDLHKFLGVVVLIWITVVSLTGVLLAMRYPIYNLWSKPVIDTALLSYQGKPLPEKVISLQKVVNMIHRKLPGSRVEMIIYPDVLGNPSPYHYYVWTQGITPLTEHLYTPVLVDATTGQLTAVVKRPWYASVLGFASPLHVGNYGGLPLKILWALLDLLTIGMLVSGIYGWVIRNKKNVPLPVQEQHIAMPHYPNSFRQIWGFPIVIGIMTTIGLVSSLVGTGIWHWISWIALALPIVTAAWFGFINWKDRR